MTLEIPQKPRSDETVERRVPRWFAIADTPEELQALIDRFGGIETTSIEDALGISHSKAKLKGMLQGKEEHPQEITADMLPDIGDLRETVRRIWPENN